MYICLPCRFITTTHSTRSAEIENNPFYDIYLKKDIDKDGVEDELDNCKSIYNPNQQDSNAD
jgi:hypothetical protein